jgi:hypothetical protein
MLLSTRIDQETHFRQRHPLCNHCFDLDTLTVRKVHCIQLLTYLQPELLSSPWLKDKLVVNGSQVSQDDTPWLAMILEAL